VANECENGCADGRGVLWRRAALGGLWHRSSCSDQEWMQITALVEQVCACLKLEIISKPAGSLFTARGRRWRSGPGRRLSQSDGGEED
jgi:hypothetical protein